MEAIVWVAPSAERAEEWAVVLEASGIANRLEETPAGWAVVVAAGDVARARRALAAYDEENRPGPAPSAGFAEYGRNWAGVAMAALLILGYGLTGGSEAGRVWFERGSASAELILKGEVWRAVTALTLHVDAVHLLANALACAAFVTAAGTWLGPGLALWLVLLAGALGNLLTAAVHGARHVAVGASGATFGALGLLAARQFALRRRRPWARRTAWLVVAASLALLGLLGTGPGTDILAHLFGLVAGAALGSGAALTVRRPPGRRAQWALAAAAAASVLAAWWLALAGPPRL